MLIILNRVERFIRDYEGTKCKVLFGTGKYDAIYDRIKYPIGLKSGITNVFSPNYAKIKIDSDNDLSSEETLTLQNVIKSIELVFQNYYYCNTFLEKYSYQLPKK